MTKESEDIVLKKLDRYISVEGTYINQLAGKRDHDVLPGDIRNRELRDGYDHHITLVNHLEISQIARRQQDKEIAKTRLKKLFRRELNTIYQAIVETFGDGSDWEKPIDLGMGICKDKDATSYYRVIYWPFGQTIRKFLGLPQTNFHITVGFSPNDVHLYKGPASLLCLQKDQVCRNSTMSMLVSFIDYYQGDSLFIKELFNTCWRHSLIAELNELVKACAENKKE